MENPGVNGLTGSQFSIRMDGGDVVTFTFQLGLVRDSATVDTSLLTLKTLKEEACKFILKKVRSELCFSFV